LTGRTPGAAAISGGNPIVQRAAKMLAECPDAGAPLAAFLDVLAGTLKFPETPAAEVLPIAVPKDSGSYRQASWIPVLGRTAAGVAQFWSSEAESGGLTTLNELIARHTGRSEQRTRAATATADQADEFTVQLITLTNPDGEVSEFIAAPKLKEAHPDAFAVRIDGESMAPDIRHGDLVILSPSVQAVDGQPAVVQLSRQIGVTCKIYRRQGGRVHLIPINEQFPPQAFGSREVVWSLDVLTRIRP